jgi:hypothetical protein
MTASRKGFFNAFKDVWMLDGVRTPMVDYCGALGHISPTDWASRRPARCWRAPACRASTSAP